MLHKMPLSPDTRDRQHSWLDSAMADCARAEGAPALSDHL
jgi:hypothetical protein